MENNQLHNCKIEGCENQELQHCSESYEGNDYNYFTKNKEGQIHGKYISGDCCSQIETVYNYVNGKKEGKSYTHYKYSNFLLEECYYENDLLNGEYIRNFENGNLKIKANYRRGFFEGEYVEYFQNGNIKIKTFYEDYNFNGKYNENFEDGSEKIQCYYKDGELIGLYVEWNDKGKIIKNILN